MKYYQCKNHRKVIYPVSAAYFMTTGFLSITSYFGIMGEKSIFAGVGFTVLMLIGIIFFVSYSKKICGNYKSTIEFNEESIIYNSRNNHIEIKWRDIAKVYIDPREFVRSYNRIIYFMTINTSIYKLESKVSERMIWSEYNDEMLEEIKKYWHGDIVNEDKYMKWRNKNRLRINSRKL